MSNVATYPLSVIVARLQTQRQKRTKSSDEKIEGEEEGDGKDGYTDILDAARKLYRKGGVKEFYPGLAQDTAKTVADSFLFFLAYSFVRQRRIKARFGTQRARKHTSVVLPVLDELAIGILAGAFSKLFTTPLANIVTRKQTATSGKNSGEIAAQIRDEKGVEGFWSGYSATLILTLNPSITLFLNEISKYVLLSREKREKPSPMTTFLLAALSKAAASSITYPISMAKARAQAAGNNPESKSQNNTKNTNIVNRLTPQILTTVLTIARTEGPTALYSGLAAEVLKGFFSHGFTMLTKDAVYSLIVKTYYLLLLALRRYPSPEELIERAREQTEEYAETAREGAKDLAERAKEGAEEVLERQPGHVAVEGTSGSSSGNPAADLAGDYVDWDGAKKE